MGRAFEVRKASMLKTGMAKAKVYSRHSKEIYLSAKNGADPESNLTLKRNIEKAKKDQVPADVIKRAIEKATSGAGEEFRAKNYEGFGPNGATIIVNCLTDNDNRTISEVKNCFTKSENRLGVEGSVTHMYKFLGVLSVKGKTEDEMMELLLDNDLDVIDIEVEDDVTTLLINPADFNNTRNIVLENINEEDLLFDEVKWVPQVDVELEGDDMKSFEKLLSMLEEVDDVQNVYHNVDNV